MRLLPTLLFEVLLEAGVDREQLTEIACVALA